MINATVVPLSPKESDRVRHIDMRTITHHPYLSCHVLHEPQQISSFNDIPLLIKCQHDQRSNHRDTVCFIEVAIYSLSSDSIIMPFFNPLSDQDIVGIRVDSNFTQISSFLGLEGQILTIKPHKNPDYVLIFRISCVQSKLFPVLPRISYIPESWLTYINTLEINDIFPQQGVFVRALLPHSKLLSTYNIHVFSYERANALFKRNLPSPKAGPSEHMDISIIKLNVGGSHFTTTRQTLMKIPYFTKQIPSFIDRDGELFGYLLKYIRGDQHAHYLPKDRQIRELLAVEAEFYQMGHLKTKLLQQTSKMPLQMIYFNHSEEKHIGRIMPNQFSKLKHTSFSLSLNENTKCLLEWTLGNAAGHFAIVINGQQTGIIASNGFSIVSDQSINYTYASMVTIRKVLQLPAGDHHISLVASSFDPVLPYEASGPVIIQVQRIPEIYFEN